MENDSELTDNELISPLDLLPDTEVVRRMFENLDSDFEFILMDIDKREIAKKDIREVLDKEEIKKFSQLGFKLNINTISNAEKFVETYFKLNQYIVSRCTAKRIDYDTKVTEDDFIKKMEEERNIINNYLHQKYHIENIDSLIKAGIPDFLIYKKIDNQISELCFVEVKKRIDALRFEQMIWIFSNKIPVKIVIL